MKKGKNDEIKKIWQFKLVEYLSYIIIFLTPLYVNKNSYLSVFSFPKAMIIIGGTLFLSIFYLWGSFKYKNLKFKITPLHIALFIFAIILTISSIWGIDPRNSFLGNFMQSINLILIYTIILYSLIIGGIVRNNREFAIHLLLISFMSSIFVALSLYTNIFNSLVVLSKDGIGGTTGNTSYTGTYLFFNIFFGLALFLYYKKYWQKILVSLGVIFIAFSPSFFNINIFKGQTSIIDAIHNPILFLGFSNAAILGLVVSFLFTAFLFLTKSSKKILQIMGLVSIVILLVGLWVGSSILNNPSSKIHRGYAEQKSENRFIAWDIARIGFINSPILGVGFNNYSHTYQKYFSPDIFKKKNNPEVYFNQPHNILWEYLSNNGILGLINYLSILVLIFIFLYNTRTNEDDQTNNFNNIKIVLAGILLGYFVQNLFGFDTPITYLMYFSVIGIGLGMYNRGWEININKKYNVLVNIFKGLIILGSLVLFVVFVILPWKEAKRWNKIAISESISEVLALRGENTEDISLWGGSYDSSRLANNYFNTYQANINMINDNNKDYYLKDIKLLTKQIEKELEKSPDDIFSHITASQLLDLYMVIDNKKDEEMWTKSMYHLEQAKRINPLNPEIYMILARTHIINNDFKNANLAIREAIVIAPEYKYSYDVAKSILKIKKNLGLENFVNQMEQKWKPGFVTREKNNLNDY